jgi:hypothetical protein
MTASGRPESRRDWCAEHGALPCVRQVLSARRACLLVLGSVDSKSIRNESGLHFAGASNVLGSDGQDLASYGNRVEGPLPELERSPCAILST